MMTKSDPTTKVGRQARRDISLVTGVLQAFFRQRRIRKTLSVIVDQSISGWENWLQVEFGAFLSGNPSLGEWSREKPLRLDRRRGARRKSAEVDFVLRQKWGRRNRYILVELKQRKSTTSCIRAMMRDLLKLTRLRASAVDARSFWAVGLHPKERRVLVRKRVIKNAQKQRIPVREDLVVTKVVRRTPLAWTAVCLLPKNPVPE